MKNEKICNENYAFSIDNFTLKHTGKMSGMISLSTSTLKNTFCNKYCQMKGSICSKCYSRRQLSYQHTLAEKLAKNYDILHAGVIPMNDMPVVNASICRFESFGDIDSTIQFENYCNICFKNPGITFTLWTKNPGIIKKALMHFNKPENLIIIYSSMFINEAYNIKKIKKAFPFIDKIFSVFDKKTAETLDIKINCGSKKCNECRLCYSKNTTCYINELLK